MHIPLQPHSIHVRPPFNIELHFKIAIIALREIAGGSRYWKSPAIVFKTCSAKRALPPIQCTFNANLWHILSKVARLAHFFSMNFWFCMGEIRLAIRKQYSATPLRSSEDQENLFFKCVVSMKRKLEGMDGIAQLNTDFDSHSCQVCCQVRLNALC